MSVVGPPGVGKSALVAQLTRPRALGDVVWVACSEGLTAAALGHLLVRAAGVSPPSSDTDEGIGRNDPAAFARLALRGRRDFVVFDDADACLPVVVDYVVACLAVSRSVRCLVTTRERMRLPGESILRLDPLAVPEETDDPDEALLAPSVQLLVARACAADARFSLGRHNTRAVTLLVRALEGLPLAISSFAGRFGAVGTSELARQAEKRNDLFTNDAHGTADRGRNLESAISSSWNDLSTDLRDSLAALSMFQGPFGLESAAAVISADDEVRARAHVARALEELIDRSLLQTARMEEPRRYVLLRSIREFARDRLVESGKEEPARRALVARLSKTFGTTAYPRAVSDDFDAASYEYAFQIAVELGEPEQAAKLALSLGATFLGKGPYGRYGEILTTALDRHQSLSAELRGELHFNRGLARLLGGARDLALDDFAAARTLASKEVRAAAASKEALVVGLKGRFEDARRLFAEARGLLAGVDRPELEGRIHKDAANVHSEEGSEDAYSSLVAARACFVRSGEARERAFVEMLLASRLLDEGKTAAAKTAGEELLTVFHDVGDERSLAWTYTILGLIEQEESRFGIARERYEQGKQVAKRVGDVHTEGLILGYMAGLELELGEVHEAALRGGEALHALELAKDKHAKAMVSAVVGAAYAELGHPRLAEEAMANARAALAGDGRKARRVAVELLALSVSSREATEQADLMTKRRELTLGVAPTEEIRFALRYVDRLVGDDAPPSRRGPSELVVAEDGSWVRAPSGQLVALARRPVLRRLVHALVKEREKNPGKPVSATQLVRQIWPSEKILVSAAMNRLYVAITRLRDEGLADAIEHRGDGYLFKASLGLRRQRGEAPES